MWLGKAIGRQVSQILSVSDQVGLFLGPPQALDMGMADCGTYFDKVPGHCAGGLGTCASGTVHWALSGAPSVYIQ